MQAATVVKMAMVGLHAGTKKLMTDWAVDGQNLLAVDGRLARIRRAAVVTLNMLNTVCYWLGEPSSS